MKPSLPGASYLLMCGGLCAAVLVALFYPNYTPDSEVLSRAMANDRLVYTILCLAMAVGGGFLAVRRWPHQTSLWKLWAREAGYVFIGGWSRVSSRLWIILGAVVLGGLVVFFANAGDEALLKKIRQADAPQLGKTAGFVSRWGDMNFSAPFAIALWAIGAIRNRGRWRKFGLALLMAGLVSGLILNIFRVGLGRPRPNLQETNPQLADGFYGPHFRDGNYQSYPSGHACSSATTGSTLAAFSPVLALPGVVYATAVSWSRMQLNRHHPIDVAIGATIGTVCGLSFASTVPGAWIKLRRRKRPAKN